MKTSVFQGRVASCVIGVVSLLQMSPAVASAPNTGPGMTQGSRSPGFPAPGADAAKNKHRGPVDITFTKWVTTFPRMEGFTGGDIPGDFVGEVFQRQVSLDGRVIRLEAIYEVQAGDHSFTALIRGGTGATNDERAGQCVGRRRPGRRGPGRVADRRASACGIPHHNQLPWCTGRPNMFPGHDSH